MRSDWDAEIDEFVDGLEDAIEVVVKETAKTAMKEVVSRSPIWSGAYILSHRVGVNGKSSRGPVRLDIVTDGGFPPKMSSVEAEKAKQAALSELNRLRTVHGVKSIVISNEAQHALEVEYGNDVNLPARNIYAHSEIAAHMELDRLISILSNMDPKQFVTLMRSGGGS